MDWITPLMNEYHRWIKSRTIITSDSQTQWVSISTPFVGIFNDTLEIYARKFDNKVILSDNGETLQNLELVGVKLRKGERKEIAERILINYGASLKGRELFMETNERNFPQKKHSFISAMIELNDLQVLAKNKVSTIFKEDVRSYLDEKEIIYTPDFISRGSTGLEFTFDFQIAQRKQEIVLKSFNTLNKLNLPGFLFAWEDIKPVREKVTRKEIKAIAIINDMDKEIKEEYLEALISRNADFIYWSQRSSPGNMKKIAA